MFKLTTNSYGLTLVLLFFGVYNQAEAASAEEALIESCQGYIDSNVIPEDSVCYEYINGFIDGAILTDTAIIENITKEEKEFSTFFQRAYKTRVGQQNRTIPPTYFAKFCLPEETSRKTIIENLIHQLNAELLTKQSFKQTLYETLKRVYSCE